MGKYIYNGYNGTIYTNRGKPQKRSKIEKKNNRKKKNIQ
jgi:hypothetical protein